MDTTVIWTIVVIAALGLLVAVGIIAATRRARLHRGTELRGQFGPEYDRAVVEYGGAKKAERELARRARRVEHFRFRELNAGDRARFSNRSAAIQAQFVDDPAGAVLAANELISDVMSARGYPSRDFDQRVADLSVHHAAVVQHYRAAHALSAAPNRTDAGSTEDLRQAVVHYRSLFAELLAPAAAEDRVQELRHAHAVTRAALTASR
jgi:hypothetical protein